MAPNMAKPITKPMAEVEEKVRLCSSPSGMTGSAARRSTNQKATSRMTAATPMRKIGGREPAVGVPAQAGQQDQGGGGGGQERRPGVVDHVVDPDGRGRQYGGGDHQGHHPDGDVHVEDPVPGQLVHEEAADERPDDAGDGEDRAEHALVAPPLPGRDHVTDRGHGPHDEPPGPEPLDGPEQDQLHHVPAEPGQHRTDQEDHDGGLEEELPPVLVAELPPQRRRRRRSQQIGGDHPRQVGQPVQVPGDGRQRRGHDRLIERGQQQAQQQPHHDQPDLRLGQVRRCSGGPGSDLRGAHRHGPHITGDLPNSLLMPFSGFRFLR